MRPPFEFEVNLRQSRMATTSVNLGLIGLGPWWETRVRPALLKLRSRLQVVAVYDSVLVRADQAARELGAKSIAGVKSLLDRSDVNALLVLDSCWIDAAWLPLLYDTRKPVLWGAHTSLSLHDWQHWHEQFVRSGQTCVPMLPKRSTPASIRLQELMATQLGKSSRIDIAMSPVNRLAVPFATDADLGRSNIPPIDPLWEWIDWCCYLFRGEPMEILRQPNAPELTLSFGPASSDPLATVRTANITVGVAPPIADQPHVDTAHVVCERGEARLVGTTDIEWTHDGEQTSESLSSERSELEVLLDQFCRRVVGGLVPTPDLGDLCQAMSIAQTQAAD